MIAFKNTLLIVTSESGPTYLWRSLHAVTKHVLIQQPEAFVLEEIKQNYVFGATFLEVNVSIMSS